MSFREKILILAVSTIPFGNLVRLDIGNAIAVLPADILLTLLLLSNGLHMIREKRFLMRKMGTSMILMALFVLICVISLLIHVSSYQYKQLLIGFAYLYRFVIYGQLLFAGYFISKNGKVNVRRVLVYSGLIYVVLGIGQFFMFPDLKPLFYLGWDDHLFRLYGTFLDPNFSGAFIVISFFMLLSDKGVLGKHTLSTKHGFLFAHVLALVLTFSRSSYVMFIASGIVLFILNSRGNLRKSLVIHGVLFVMMLTISIVLTSNIQSEGVNVLRTSSVHLRIKEDIKALTLAARYPFFGVGFNLIRYASFNEGLTTSGDWVITHSGAGIPNSYLFVLATTGVTGFLAYVFFWISVIWIVVRRNDNVLCAILCGLAVHSLFENTLFYPFIMMYVFTQVSSALHSSHLDTKAYK